MITILKINLTNGVTLTQKERKLNKNEHTDLQRLFFATSKLALVITLLLLSSCSGKNSDNAENSKERLDNSNTQPHIEEEVVKQGKPKTALDLLLEDGLVIADSTENCGSHKWIGEPKTKLIFKYPQGNKLILEEWETPIEDNELNLLDFLIFDCRTGHILLEAQYTTADYRIIDVKPNLRIQINADIPTLNDGYSRQPFLIKTFKEVDSEIITEVERIFEIPNPSNEVMTKLETEYSSRRTIEDDQTLELENFASDEILLQLFRGAINGNRKADSLFHNIQQKYALDGAFAQLYGDLSYLLSEAENKHNELHE